MLTFLNGGEQNTLKKPYRQAGLISITRGLYYQAIEGILRLTK